MYLKGDISVLKRQTAEKNTQVFEVSLVVMTWFGGGLTNDSGIPHAVKCVYDLDMSSTVERKGKTTFWSGWSNKAWDGRRAMYRRVNIAFIEPSTWIFGRAGFWILSRKSLKMLFSSARSAAVSRTFGYGLVLLRVSVRSLGPRKEGGLWNWCPWQPAGGGRYHQSETAQGGKPGALWLHQTPAVRTGYKRLMVWGGQETEVSNNFAPKTFPVISDVLEAD